MATNIEKNTRGGAGRKPPRAADQAKSKDLPAASPSHMDEDYRDASGRDHPAESEHDHAPESEQGHARQKLNGKSAKMARQASRAGNAGTTERPDKS